MAMGMMSHSLVNVASIRILFTLGFVAVNYVLIFSDFDFSAHISVWNENHPVAACGLLGKRASNCNILAR